MSFQVNLVALLILRLTVILPDWQAFQACVLKNVMGVVPVRNLENPQSVKKKEFERTGGCLFMEKKK